MLDMDVVGRRSRALVASTVVAFGLATSVGVAVAPPAGAATYLGSAAQLVLFNPIVDMTATPTAQGYWLVGSDGAMFNYGDAHNYGSMAGRRLNKPVVGMAPVPLGNGYWLVASDGGIFTFGASHFYGSTGGKRLNKPIVGIAATPSGRGYWLVASDGGIFTFGDAHFYGSTGDKILNQPIVGMAATPSGRGYWLVASDGGIFTFGDAHFYGSTGNRRLASPIVAMSMRHGGGGYWLAGRDGSVFAFGTASYYGSATGAMAGQQAVNVVGSPKNDGYWVASQWGGVDTASSAGVKMDPNLVPRTGEAAIQNELMQRINTERATRGFHSLFANAVLNMFATYWAHYLANTHQFTHQDLGTIMNAAGGAFEEVGENLFGASGAGATDAGAAHVALMNSDGHRANILLPEEQFMGIGAACVGDSLIVVEDFATPSGVPMPAHPIPPLNPIAAPNEGGASC